MATNRENFETLIQEAVRHMAKSNPPPTKTDNDLADLVNGITGLTEQDVTAVLNQQGRNYRRRLARASGNPAASGAKKAATSGAKKAGTSSAKKGAK